MSVDEKDPDELMSIIEDLEYALYDRALDITVSGQQNKELSYLQIVLKN
jgi:hypothetical protein